MSDPIKHTMMGVDVAKLKLDIAVGDNKVLSIDNHEEGFKELLKIIPDRDQACFVMGATGGYERKGARFLPSKNIAVAVINAKRVRDYANAMGAYAKNDRIDARMIRHYAQVVSAKGRLKLRESRTGIARQLEGLLRRRNQLVGQRAVEKQHLEATINKGSARSISRMIKQLDKGIERIENRIKAYIEDDGNLGKQKGQLQKGQLMQVPGVGEVTALALLTRSPELGKLSNFEVLFLSRFGGFAWLSLAACPFGVGVVTVKLSELVFVLGLLACGAAFRFLWLAAWVFWLVACDFGGFWLVSVGYFRPGGVGVSALCGSAVRRAVRVRGKMRHPQCPTSRSNGTRRPWAR